MESFIVSDFSHESFKENLVDKKIEQDVINISQEKILTKKYVQKWRDMISGKKIDDKNSGKRKPEDDLNGKQKRPKKMENGITI